jgi:hypothetical protein
MPWMSWTSHAIPLWLPDRWTTLDDYLLEIDATIEAHNRPLTWNELPHPITLTPWRVLLWLWRLELIALRGCLSYRNPQPQIITAVLNERSVRSFTYDGDRVYHVLGEVWCAVEVMATEALTQTPPATPSSGDAEMPASAPINPNSNNPWENELRLPGIIKNEPPAPPSISPDGDGTGSPPGSGPPVRRGRGRPSQVERIVAAFKTLSDKQIGEAKSLSSLFPAVLAEIPGSLTTKGEPTEGFDNRSLRRHLRPLYTERRTKPGTKTP